jgi:hypothetical protein
VKGREHEVPRLGCRQGGGDRLEVPHLADEDHVRVLAQSGLQAEREALRVAADLALVHDAALVPVQELDRVLDREDVLLAALVDLVDHRRQGGRLARAGGTRHQHEAARLLDEVVYRRRQPQLVDALDLGRDEAEGGPDRRALHVSVDSEAAVRGHRVREVDLPVLLQPLALVVRQDPVDQVPRVLRGERPVALERAELTADAYHRRGPDGHVQVGRLELDGLLEALCEIDFHLAPIRQEGQNPLLVRFPESR